MPVRGGGEPLLTNFIPLLTPFAEDIFVITGDFPPDSIRDKKVHIKNVTYDTSNKKRSTLKASIQYVLTQLKISAELFKLARKVNLVIFSTGLGLLMPTVLIAKLLRKKILLAVTGSGPEVVKQAYKDRLWGKGGFIFPRVIAIMEAVAHNLANKIVVEASSVVLRPGMNKHRDKIVAESSCFADTNLFQPRKKLSDRGNLVGYIGRLSREKGVMNFIEAIPLILKERNNIEFLIGGDGSLFSEIEQGLKNFKPGEKVRLTGWIPHDELPDYLNEMKLAILPSYTEGLPNLVLEIMACGTPLLATPVGGIPDVIKDGETGLILEDNSPECIAKGVIKALNYPHLDTIATNARNLIEKRYTHQVVMEGWRRIIAGMK